MIPVFVASSNRFAEIEWMTPYSIQRNSSVDVRIHVIRPEDVGMQESGCTGFSMIRYAVPELCREHGYSEAIYLDIDMLVTGDISELWQYRQPGKWVTLTDSSDEVSIISAEIKYPAKEFIHRRHRGTLHKADRVAGIPPCWNVEDRVEPDMRLLHFTNLDTQPWFHEHPCKEAVEIYRQYESDYLRDRAKSRPGAAATA